MRAALLAIFGLYLLIGPVGRQLLDLPVPPAFQTWRMFVGKARETCQVRLHAVRPGGAVEALPLELRRRGRRVEREHLTRIERWACVMARRRNGRGAGVRVEARCGSRRRWVTENDGTRDVCR